MLRLWRVGLFCICLVGTTAFSQNSTTNDFVQNTIFRLQKFTSIPYEKLYLQLDKPYYSAGENIWYAGYLVNGATNQLSSYSRYIYTELINQSDSVIARFKIRKDSLGFCGNLPLPATLSPGNYRLRAYSWWMQNYGTDFFFQRDLYIGNAIDKSIQSNATFQQANAHQMSTDIAFSSDDHISFAGRKINYKIFQGEKLLHSKTTAINEQGHARFGMDYDSLSSDRYHINITFDDPTYIYSRNFYIDLVSHEFDLQFFPEGGNLLNNGTRNIAFKAIRKDGRSVEVAGTVYNQKGDSITHFTSQHKGMGFFSIYLNDKAPVQYYAKVHVIGSTANKTFSLPEIKNSSNAINLFVHKDKIFYTIISADKQHSANQKMFLLIHQRGKLHSIISVSDTSKWIGSLKTETLLPGIVHFLLLDESGNALSERIAFANSPNQSSINLQADKKTYTPRSLVQLHAALQNREDSTISGKFSIAITDDKTVKYDSLSDNIRSSLLLTSDLKGCVEDPAFYFKSNSGSVDPFIDLVMLTHGWTRFDIPSIIKGNYPAFPYYVEQGQSLSGRIKGFWGGSAKKAQIIVIEPKSKLLRTITADNKGQFVIDKLSFSDTATFIIQALSKKGHASVELQMDNELFPVVTKNKLHPTIPPTTLMTDYLNTMAQKFHYEGGERIYHLREITITANKIESSSRNLLYAGLGHPITEETIAKKYPGRTVMDIISSIPGIRIMDDQILLNARSKGTPEVVIDDFTYHAEDEDIIALLSSINSEEVSYINIIKGTEAAIFHNGGGNGAIVIELKQGTGYIPVRPSLGLAVVRPIGYYKPNQFYSPKYETTEQINNPNPDLRTTIYWNPSFSLVNKQSATLSFYTADRPGYYTVTLEGITSAGEPLHYQTKLSIK